MSERENPLQGMSPVFTDAARWLAAVVLITGPLLQAIEFLAGYDVDNPAERVAFWTDHPAQISISMTSGLLAVPFLLGTIAVVVALTRMHSQRLAWIGGIFMTSGVVGLAAAHGYELAAYGLTLAGDEPAAAAVLNGNMLGLPGVVLFMMFIGGAMLGTLILAIAAWRSPFVPRVVVLFMMAFGVLDFAASQGILSHLVNLAGFIILAIAVVRRYSRPSTMGTLPAVESGA